MKDDLRNAFDRIQANDDLKNKTMYYLQNRMNKRRHTKIQSRFKFVAICSAFLIFMLISGISYFTPVAYVDMDVNPSIGIVLNKFDLVIATKSYNDEGSLILRNVSIHFKKYSKALEILMDAIISNGYLSKNELVSMTVQAEISGSENSMLNQLKEVVAASLSTHHVSADTDIYSITEEVRNNALNHHITPAKYIAITELQAIDSSINFDACIQHSVSEIKKLKEKHGNQKNTHEPEDNKTPENSPAHDGYETKPFDNTSAPINNHHDNRHHNNNKH